MSSNQILTTTSNYLSALCFHIRSSTRMFTTHCGWTSVSQDIYSNAALPVCVSRNAVYFRLNHTIMFKNTERKAGGKNLLTWALALLIMQAAITTIPLSSSFTLDLSSIHQRTIVAAEATWDKRWKTCIAIRTVVRHNHWSGMWNGSKCSTSIEFS